MRILFVCTAYTPDVVGGAELSSQYLAEGLARAGVEVRVVTGQRACQPTRERINGVEVIRVRPPNLYWSLDRHEHGPVGKALFHLASAYNVLVSGAVAEQCREFRPDIVHTKNIADFPTATWRVGRAAGAVVAHTIPDYGLLCPRTTMFKHGRNCTAQCAECRVLSLPRKRMSQHVDLVIGVSRFVLDRHLQHGYFRNAEHRVIHTNLTPRAAVPPRTRHRPLTFGYIGRLCPTKGIDVVIKTLANSPMRGRCRLLVAGTGLPEDVRHLKTLAAGVPVEFLGFHEPGDFFAKVDVVIVPSVWQEPQGRVVFESYAFGLPVIAAERGGIPEMVEDGVTGFLFDPDRPETLETRIAQFVENPELVDAMAANLTRVAPLYSEAHIVGEHLNAYRSVGGGRFRELSLHTAGV